MKKEQIFNRMAIELLEANGDSSPSQTEIDKMEGALQKACNNYPVFMPNLKQLNTLPNQH